MIKLLEFPTKYSNTCDIVENIDLEKLISYNDNYYKYGNYFIDKNNVTINKKTKKRGTEK